MTCCCAQDPGPSIRPYFRLEMHGVPVRRPRTHPHRTRQKKYSRRNGGTPSFGLPQTSREKYTHVRSASGVESLFHGRRPTDGAPCLIVPTFPPTRSKLCPWELFVGRTTVTKSKPKFSVAALLEVLPDPARPCPLPTNQNPNLSPLPDCEWPLVLPLRQEGEEEDTRATVKEPCPKCAHTEAKYATLQMRSSDEGQTVFYECTKCKHVWSINS